MGWTNYHTEISVSLSSHNSPEDEDHEALYTELRERVRAIVDEPKYQAIGAMMI
ncbi:hypothetical protein [Streptacidiphilus sp. EB103A]|uniref:hypothetical protein n=1 Tax=Streptacidiphilus sp. EB103A TaxID=3156275 RepID=UPI0035153E2D